MLTRIDSEANAGPRVRALVRSVYTCHRQYSKSDAFRRDTTCDCEQAGRTAKGQHLLQVVIYADMHVRKMDQAVGEVAAMRL